MYYCPSNSSQAATIFRRPARRAQEGSPVRQHWERYGLRLAAMRGTWMASCAAVGYRRSSVETRLSADSTTDRVSCGSRRLASPSSSPVAASGRLVGDQAQTDAMHCSICSRWPSRQAAESAGDWHLDAYQNMPRQHSCMPRHERQSERAIRKDSGSMADRLAPAIAPASPPISSFTKTPES